MTDPTPSSGGWHCFRSLCTGPENCCHPSVCGPLPPAPSQRDPELAAALNEQRRQSYNAETLRTRPAPSSDTPDLGPWCCYADEVGMYGDGICSPEDPRHAPTHCGYDNVRRGLAPAPSSDTPAHSGRPDLTLREAAIEAILIREQDTAFSVVARHIAALFTSLDAIPSAPPVPSEASGRAAPTPFETFQAGMAAGLLSTRHALIHDYTEDEVRQEFRDWLNERAADRGEPTP